MRTKNGAFYISDFSGKSRFKSVQVAAMSLFATFKLMAQDQNPPPTTADAGAGATDSVPPTQQEAAPSSDVASMPPPLLRAPKATKNEVSLSGDVMLGSGTITLPLGYSLKKSLGDSGASLQPEAVSADRDSIYYGATISYSYGQAWYLDLSYAQGQSSGSQTIDTQLGSLSSSFSINDTWYQLFVKYTFPQLRGKRLSAYLRAGASLVTADLQDDSQIPGGGRYTQTDTTQDLLGNIGAGLGYTVYSSSHLRLGLQVELEGFYGVRSQDSLETLSAVVTADPFVSASIDNTLYGGIGRVTMRAEYRLGQSGLFKLFGEVGAEGRYTLIDYPGGAGAPDELLWGPYAKLGLRYAF